MTLLLGFFVLYGIIVIDGGYTLIDEYKGTTFFSHFDFTSWNNGCGRPLSESEAITAGIINTTETKAYIGVEDKSKYTNNDGYCREVVQIQSKNSFNEGLFILNADHMPYGCGVWPAFWFMGPNWPYNGEIDVVENINLATDNQATLHTGNTCDFASQKSIMNSDITGYVASTNCSFQPGCSIEAKDGNAFGVGFDNSGGGAWAVIVNDTTGISMWSWTAKNIPNDVNIKQPNPNNWGKPFSFFPFGSWCPSSNFKSLKILIDTYLCGWAGQSGGYPFSWSNQCSQFGNNCQDFVKNNPSQFTKAYWMINYLDVYKST